MINQFKFSAIPGTTWIILLILLIACGEEYAPKPRGYFRIDLPEKEYVSFDTTYPYSFEYPAYSNIMPDERPGAEPYWLDIDFPDFKGRVHISYKQVNDNLVEYMEDSRTFVVKHIPKADAIYDSLVYRPEDRVYGLIYSIEGSNAASSCQFFVTDSLSHFVRGALYFNVTPNNDSLSPVIEFLQDDIKHLINTIRWKE
jgi:gliding motility-associated lipoprotein GldD